MSSDWSFKYETISEVTSAVVSEVLAPKCSTSSEEMTKDTEGSVETGNSERLVISLWPLPTLRTVGR